MPDDNHNNDNEDQKRAERANRPPEQTGVNVGLLAPGTQTEFSPDFADDTRTGAAGAPPPPPDYPESLLGDPVLYEHGNEPVRISVFHSAQRAYGNHVVQRYVDHLPVQRDNGSVLPPVPDVRLTPPSILQPQNPADRYGLRNRYLFGIDPRTEAIMRQYVTLQFDTLLPAVQAAGANSQPLGAPPAGSGQQPPPGGGATPPAGGGSQGAPPPAPSGGSGGTGSPSQPGGGPSTPRQASAGDVLNAALATEPFRTAWRGLQTRVSDQAASDWRRLRTGERIALISTGATIAFGALAGITLSDDPSARQLLLSQLNGRTIPVPEAGWLRVEVNTSGDAVMFGLHGDVGALLGPRFGFRPSSPSPIGGPPQPQPALPPTPPPSVQRSIQRTPYGADVTAASGKLSDIAYALSSRAPLTLGRGMALNVQRQHPAPASQQNTPQASGSKSDLETLMEGWNDQVIQPLHTAYLAITAENPPNPKNAYAPIVSVQDFVDTIIMAARGEDDELAQSATELKTRCIILIEELKPYLGMKETWAVIRGDVQTTLRYATKVGAAVRQLQVASQLLLSGRPANIRPAYAQLVAAQDSVQLLYESFKEEDPEIASQIREVKARVIVLIEELKPYLGMKQSWDVIQDDATKTMNFAARLSEWTPPDKTAGTQGAQGGDAAQPANAQRSVQRTPVSVGRPAGKASAQGRRTGGSIDLISRVAGSWQASSPTTRHAVQRVPVSQAGSNGQTRPVQRQSKGPQAQAGQAVVTFKPTVSSTYTISAKTLKEAADQIKLREEAGETSWNPVFIEAHDDNGKITGATVEVTITVLLPSWAGASQLKGDEKKAWDNFMSALKKHEQNHVDLVKEKLKDVATKMLGKSKSEAEGILKKALEALRTATDEYDTKTDHGKKEGVQIDTEEEAPPKEGGEQSIRNELDAITALPVLSLMPANRALPVQRDLWGSKATNPQFPKQPILDPHLAEMKKPEVAFFHIKNAYADRGEDGPDSLIEGVETQLKQDLSSPQDSAEVLGQLRAQKKYLSIYKNQYLLIFEGMMKGQIDSMLKKSAEVIEAEMERYGIAQIPGMAAYSQERNDDTEEVAKAAKQLIQMYTDAANLNIRLEQQARAKRPKVGPMEASEQNREISQEVNTNPELQQAWQNYEQTFDAHAAKFPILLAFRDREKAGGMVALAAGGKNPAAAAVIGKELDQKMLDINSTRENMQSGRLKLWSLPNIVSATKKGRNIKVKSFEDRIIDEKESDVSTDEKIKSVALAALGITLAIVATVATAGGALVVGGMAAGAGVGLSTVTLIKDIEEYDVHHAAHNTDLDKAKAISQHDPSLIWIAMDLIALGMDIGAAASVFKQLGGVVKEVYAAQRLVTAAAEGTPEAAEAAARLAKANDALNEALSVVPKSVADKIAGRVSGPQKAFLLNPNAPMAHAGHAGQSAAKGKGFGVFEALIPGHDDVVVVKVFPEAEAELFKREMQSVKTAANTKIGPKFLGEVDMGKGKKAFAMEKIKGGSVQGVEDEVEWVIKDGKKVGAKIDTTTKAGKEIAETAARINTLTINDVETFGRRILEEGSYVRGDLQGLIDANGRWRPIDLQSVRPLEASAEETIEMLKNMHNRNIAEYIEDLKALGPKPTPLSPAGQLPHVSTPPVQRTIQRATQRHLLAIQRDGNKSAYESNKELEEKHKKALEQAKSRYEGKPALIITLERIKMEQRKTMTLIIERIVPRPSAYPNLTGFDSEGPAIAYASTVVGNGGAVVVEADKLFFVAALRPGEEEFDRRHTYVVAPQGAIRAAIGKDGNRFPFYDELEPDPDVTKKQKAPRQAAPPSASDLRKIAGVDPEGTKAGEKPQHPDVVDIPSGQEDAFILNYFRARGLEMLDGNELVARNLFETFSPTQEGDKQKEGKGVSKGAQALIDSGRKLGVTYRDILDKEMKLQLQIGELGRARSMSWAATEPYTIRGETKQIREWVSETKEKQKEVEKKKNELLSLSPMLALMVESQAPPSEVEQLGQKAWDVAKWTSPLYWVYRGGKAIAGSKEEAENPYDRSELSKPGSPDQDEKVRKEFMKKLDAVLEAIRETRGDVVAGDADLLFGMSGLRTMVTADLNRIARGPNSGLKHNLERMLADHAVKETWKTIGEVALQIGLLFVPGGQFLSAVFGFAMAAADMSKHMQQFTASQATTDPSTALADQQAAQEALAMDTLNLALSAIDVGTSTNEALKAMEMGRKPKDPGKVKTDEAQEPRPKSPTDAPTPPGIAKPGGAKPWNHADLSDGFRGKLKGVGINPETRAISPQGVLSMSKNDWEEVKKFVLHSAENPADNAAAEFFMTQMTAYRREVDNSILRSAIADVNTEYGTKYTLEEIVEAVGSTNPSSDLDFTVKGAHSHEVVQRFNEKFAQQFGGKESAIVFDTNVYTTTAHIDVPVHTDPINPAHTIPMKPGDPYAAATIGNGAKEWDKFVKETLGKTRTAEEGEFLRAVIKEAEKNYPNDLRARLVHVHNFNQDVASQIGMCETLMSQGEAGAAKWQAHRKNLLDKTPGDKREMMKRVLDAAEHRASVYQDEVISRLQDLTGKKYTPEEVAKMAHGTAEERNLYMRARNRLYEEQLQQLAALKKRYAEATTEAEKVALATQINAKQSESLYFASEAYQTGGSILSVVQNTQKAKGNVLDPAYATILAAESRQVFMEQYGKFMAYGPTLEHDAIFKASKYAERAFYGELAHPLAAGAGQPGIVGTIKSFNGLKGKPVSEIEAWLKLHFPAGSKEESLASFFAAMEGELAGGAGRMAGRAGKPVSEMEMVWEQMAKDGGTKIFALIAMLQRARSQSGD